MEEELAAIDSIRENQEKLEKQMETILEAVLAIPEKRAHILPHEPSGEAIVTSSTATAAAPPTRAAAAPVAPSLRDHQDSGTSPLVATTTLHQRSSFAIAPQSQTSNSRSTMHPAILRSEETYEKQYTADTSQEEAASEVSGKHGWLILYIKVTSSTNLRRCCGDVAQ